MLKRPNVPRGIVTYKRVIYREGLYIQMKERMKNPVANYEMKNIGEWHMIYAWD